MKLLLAGKEYDITDALQKSTLADLYDLKVQTGIGMKTLSDSLQRMSALADPQDFLDDEEILRALTSLIWLCRRRAGEKLTVAEANAVALSDIQFKVDPADTPDEAADPTTAQTDSDLGENVAAEAPATT